MERRDAPPPADRNANTGSDALFAESGRPISLLRKFDDATRLIVEWARRREAPALPR
jgi:hypothetical protein